MGVDATGVEVPGSEEHVNHHALFAAGIPLIENLSANPSLAPGEEAVDRKALRTAAAYKEKRPLIERSILDYLTSHNQVFDYLDTANHFLGNTLLAALELGDISYASTDINWLTHLLAERNISLSVLPFFLSLYAQATQDVLGEEGRILYDWLMTESQKFDVALKSKHD